METLDLRGIPCPRNTSLALIKLSTMDLNSTLEILIDDGEPIENVPSSIALEGHRILIQKKIDSNHWLLQIQVNA